jgi:hypothetical protein
MRALALFTLLLALFAVGCGGGSSNNVAPPPVVPPVFSSAPVTVASEGTAYTYTLGATDPAGGTVSFALTSAPTGAQITGNIISWTPAASQSRVSNQFTVTANTSHGTSATQSWTVTPTGTVHVTWVDTYWDANGSSTVIHQLPSGRSFSAVTVPQSDGTYVVLPGTVDTNGVLNIPNVPAGYYWLRMLPRANYWTSSSTFDFGSTYIGSLNSLLVSPTQTSSSFQLSFTGLDPFAGTSFLEVRATPFLDFVGMPLPGDTTCCQTGYWGIVGNIDLTSIKIAYAMQYEQQSFGSISGIVLGPTLTINNLAWTNSGTNIITGGLNPSPAKALPLSIQGSAWSPLFSHVAPTAVTPSTTPFSLVTQPALTQNGPIAGQGTNFTLFAPLPNPQTGFFAFFSPVLNGCTTPPSALSAPPAILTDQDLGTIQYGDPYPASWPRILSVCQKAPVQVAIPGTSQTQILSVTNGTTVAPTSGPVAPIIGPVQNPKIDGADLFTAATVNSVSPTLSWSAPALGTPYGYNVQVLSPDSLIPGVPGPGGLPVPIGMWGPGPQLSTAKTTMTIPPGVLAPGGTYMFVITALADAQANMETAPHRTALPSGNADVLSAIITVNSAATP